MKVSVRASFFGFVFLSFLLAGCSSSSTGPTDMSGVPPGSLGLAGKTFVAFGDSITLGKGDSNYPRKPSGYPIRLERLLRVEYPDIIVVNRGVGGEETPEGVRRIRYMLAEDQPDYVLLMEGVNNIQNTGLSEATQIVEDLETMVREVKASGATPLVASILPTKGAWNWRNGTVKRGVVKAANYLIQEMAVEQDIIFVDLHAAFVSHDDFRQLLTDDDIHPNDAGYDVMADAWYFAIINGL